jgi:hypothetical protein
MSDKMELFLGLLVLLGVIVLTRQYHAWRIRRAYQRIIADLRSSNALTPETAVDLPYAGKNLLRIGLRDHRKMALNHLVLQQVVGQTDDRRYYLMRVE